MQYTCIQLYTYCCTCIHARSFNVSSCELSRGRGHRHFIRSQLTLSTWSLSTEWSVSCQTSERLHCPESITYITFDHYQLSSYSTSNSTVQSLSPASHSSWLSHWVPGNTKSCFDKSYAGPTCHVPPWRTHTDAQICACLFTIFFSELFQVQQTPYHCSKFPKFLLISTRSTCHVSCLVPPLCRALSLLRFMVASALDLGASTCRPVPLKISQVRRSWCNSRPTSYICTI